MKNKVGKFIAVLAALFIGTCAFMFAGCSVTAKRFDMMGYFGTYSSVVIGNYGEVSEAADKAAEEIETLLASAEKAISSTVEGSDIARFNEAKAGERMEISRLTYEIMNIAAEMYEITDGYYNPAVGNLVDLWGFTPRFDDPDYTPTEPYDRENASVPAEEYITAFSSAEITDFGAITLSEKGGKYYIEKPTATVTVVGKTYSMNIDLGGIGKGYVADLCADIFSEYGLNKSYVSIGTSSLRLGESAETAKGAPEKNMYKVTLNHPRGSGEYLSVYAKNVAGSTSGDYERYFIQDGIRYSHLIDPFSGRPTDSGFVTGTVFGKSAAEGDALTTALAVKDKKSALTAASGSGYKYALLYAEGDGYTLYTNMSADKYVLFDDGIAVIEEQSID